MKQTGRARGLRIRAEVVSTNMFQENKNNRANLAAGEQLCLRYFPKFFFLGLHELWWWRSFVLTEKIFDNIFNENEKELDDAHRHQYRNFISQRASMNSNRKKKQRQQIDRRRFFSFCFFRTSIEKFKIVATNKVNVSIWVKAALLVYQVRSER